MTFLISSVLRVALFPDFWLRKVRYEIHDKETHNINTSWHSPATLKANMCLIRARIGWNDIYLRGRQCPCTVITAMIRTLVAFPTLALSGGFMCGFPLLINRSKGTLIGGRSTGFACGSDWLSRASNTTYHTKQLRCISNANSWMTNEFKSNDGKLKFAKRLVLSKLIISIKTAGNSIFAIMWTSLALSRAFLGYFIFLINNYFFVLVTWNGIPQQL